MKTIEIMGGLEERNIDGEERYNDGEERCRGLCFIWHRQIMDWLEERDKNGEECCRGLRFICHRQIMDCLEEMNNYMRSVAEVCVSFATFR